MEEGVVFSRPTSWLVHTAPSATSLVDCQGLPNGACGLGCWGGLGISRKKEFWPWRREARGRWPSGPWWPEDYKARVWGFEPPSAGSEGANRGSPWFLGTFDPVEDLCLPQPDPPPLEDPWYKNECCWGSPSKGWVSMTFPIVEKETKEPYIEHLLWTKSCLIFGATLHGRYHYNQLYKWGIEAWPSETTGPRSQSLSIIMGISSMIISITATQVCCFQRPGLFP